MISDQLKNHFEIKNIKGNLNMAKMKFTEKCGQYCPLRFTLKLLEGKYSSHILKELIQGTKRFGELKRNVSGISPKTLSEKLKYYMESGIVKRQSYPEIPPKVEYKLTERGEGLMPIIEKLQDFGKTTENEPDEHST